LPKVKLPEGFSDSVCDRIRERGLPAPQRILAFPAPRRLTYPWKRIAVAATVLLAVGVAAVLLSNAAVRRAESPMISGNPLVKSPISAKPELAVGPTKRVTPEAGAAKFEAKLPELNRRDLEQYGQMLASLLAPLSDSMDALARTGVELAAKMPTEKSLIVSSLRPATPIKSHALHLPPLEDLRNLDQDKVRQQLNDGNAQQIDISCQESWKALERFQDACKVNGIKLILDPEVAFRQSKKMPAMYVVYLENVPADRVIKILNSLQAEDKKAEAKNKGDTQFNSVWVIPLEDPLRKWLAETLGVPVGNLIPPKATAPKGPTGNVDNTKPLAQDTQKSLEKLAPGSSSAGKPSAKEPSALVLVSGPVRTPMQMTKEVKQFVEGRLAPQPDAIHVVFLLRPSKG
jgi:hypothetical protein